MFPSVALADTATLTISGRVLPGTCTLAAPPIALDPIKADELVVGDNGLKAGVLNFTGCVGVSKAVLSFSGTAATGDAERWQNTASTDPAVGVSVALLAGATGTTYLKNGDTGIEVPVTGATASFPLRAGYYATALTGLQAGEVRSEITVTADYE
ncbi:MULTISPECIES: fimbrial protein [Stenotrophomonas]|uniref:Fimbrial protein n=2 Tax=Lysobacteraceae TaxID=32033 RepID=A0AAW3RZF8_STEMA|nr:MULTISPECIES: fimbrial protein [Stenotrophomonas]MBA0309687.1 fimbrial protein [Stenotrophomonas maltophilia]MBH1746288.1 type 1 fimbrial protein [Stenotrophomonas maltophilia]MBH1864511.1 type 1 fimbrial protein [Stenotrophomonas maltophilia]HDS1662841.1 type 1 fimbrial protein [Stenotrophomonas maltophilia]HEQ1702585.1 type 1 fimbrial protein [Stenotrophomonas maltophilia]